MRISSLTLVLLLSGSANGQELQTIKADVWADNWFALYVGSELVKEDSTPFNTEKSFNSDSFTFQTALPAQINVIIKDYKEDDSGLEYIGRSRQQMGDGGFSAQFFNAKSGDLLVVSDDSWHCLAIHRAPLNRACEDSADPMTDCQSDISAEPDNWKEIDFDDGNWPNAVVHSAAEVRPLRGYFDIEWQASVELIWTDDIVIDNTILCRTTIK